MSAKRRRQSCRSGNRTACPDFPRSAAWGSNHGRSSSPTVRTRPWQRRPLLPTCSSGECPTSRCSTRFLPRSTCIHRSARTSSSSAGSRSCHPTAPHRGSGSSGHRRCWPRSRRGTPWRSTRSRPRGSGCSTRRWPGRRRGRRCSDNSPCCSPRSRTCRSSRIRTPCPSSRCRELRTPPRRAPEPVASSGRAPRPSRRRRR
jgi:hypothetical protein